MAERQKAIWLPGAPSVLQAPDIIWPSTNELGIPDLRLDMQARWITAPLLVWGEMTSIMKRTGGFGATILTFGGFENGPADKLWLDPSPIVACGANAVAEPNFPLSENFPPAVAYWHLYRRRWVARWWQENGVRVLVDLNYPERYEHLPYIGLPKGWRAYAQCIQGHPVDLLRQRWVRAVEHAGSEDIIYLVFGGGKEIQAECISRGWIWTPGRHGRRAGEQTVVPPASADKVRGLP